MVIIDSTSPAGSGIPGTSQIVEHRAAGQETWDCGVTSIAGWTICSQAEEAALRVHATSHPKISVAAFVNDEADGGMAKMRGHQEEDEADRFEAPPTPNAPIVPALPTVARPKARPKPAVKADSPKKLSEGEEWSAPGRHSNPCPPTSLSCSRPSCAVSSPKRPPNGEAAAQEQSRNLE